MSTFGTLESRAKAILLSAAAGDALGWPQEQRGGMVGGKRARMARRSQAKFEPWLRMSGSRYLRYSDPVFGGEYSDDTQLMLAVARSCLVRDEWSGYLERVELPAWPSYQRGGGRAVLAAANAWSVRRAPWQPETEADRRRARDYFQAGANGVAMRIAPHVIWCAARRSTLFELFQRVIRDGVTTHGHPRALVGALAYAAALDFALKSADTFDPTDLVRAAELGLISATEAMSWLPPEWFILKSHSDFAAEWDRTNAEMSGLLGTVQASLRMGSMSNATTTLQELGAIGAYAGSGVITAAGAIYLASRAGTRPISGLLQAAFEHGADTDTLASMTGALLGAMHGAEWLGSLREVQDSNYIEQMASALVSGSPLLPPIGRVTARTFMRELDQQSGQGKFLDGRRYEVTARDTISAAPWVDRVRLRLEDGQSVIVDRVHRAPTRVDFETARGAHERQSLASTNRIRAESEAALIADAVLRDAQPRVASAAIYGAAYDALSLRLPTADIAAVAAFYGKILGVELLKRSHRVRVTNYLEFEQADPAAIVWTADVNVTVRVSNLVECATALEQSIVDDAETTRYLVLVDPDGRPVTILEAE